MTQLNFPTTPSTAERRRARLARQEAEAIADTGYRLLTLGQQGSAWLAARELHARTTRYSYNDVISSAPTKEGAREDCGDDWTEGDDLHTFDICAECGRVEMENGRDDYLESIWPCPTARALGAEARG